MHLRRLDLLVVDREREQRRERLVGLRAVDVHAEPHAVAHRHEDVPVDHEPRVAGLAAVPAGDVLGRRKQLGHEATERIASTIGS